MVQVRGTVHDVSDNPERVERIVVRAVEPRMHGSTYITEESVPFPVVDGVLDFNVLPGPCVVAFLRPHGATTYEKLLVPDVAEATFRECLDAAALAEEGTKSALEKVVRQIQEELNKAVPLVEEVRDLRTSVNESKDVVDGYVKEAQNSAAEAASSESNAKGHETTAGDYASVATTAATEAVNAMERATEIAGGDFATQEYVDASTWTKTPLAGSDNIDELTPGLYPVRSGSIATALGLPEGTIGFIEHVVLDPSSLYRRQYYRADPTSGPSSEYRRTYYNGTWNAWESTAVVPHRRGKVDSTSVPDTMTGTTFEGLWNYDSTQAIAWGLPSQAAGFMDISVSGFSTLQEITTLTTPIQSYRRRWYNGKWSGDWESTGGAGQASTAPDTAEYDVDTSKTAINLLIPSVVDPTLSYKEDHAALVEDMKSRRGTVDTQGKAAVALVADHGTTVFKQWLWEAAKERGIPFTMALAPEVHLDGKGDSRHTASNDDIKQWISEGLDIASHSGDHDGATGYFDVARQIVTSKRKLEEKLETTVDSWVQPGYSLANGSYDGFGTGQSDARYTDFYAGRLLQQTYPVITGYAGSDFVYPGGVDLPVGVRRSLTERKDALQGVKDYIQQAVDTKGKHINFCHPYALVESSNTYVTKTEYIEFLDWLAQKRDNGELVLLTLPELAVAQ